MATLTSILTFIGTVLKTILNAIPSVVWVCFFCFLFAIFVLRNGCSCRKPRPIKPDDPNSGRRIHIFRETGAIDPVTGETQ